MVFRVLADTVITIHFLWIVFLLFGAIAGARWKPVRYLHISGLLFAIYIQTSRSLCPLTTLESWLEGQAGLAAYSGSFIVHYLDKMVYLRAPEWAIIVLTWLLCGFNAFFYIRKPLMRRMRRLPPTSTDLQKLHT